MNFKPSGFAVSRRTLLAGAAALGTALALSGKAFADQTTLTFFSWDGEAVMKPLIDAFQTANPDITIEFSNAPPVNEYISTLQTRLVSGTAADVFIMAAENKSALIDGGFVKDLTDRDYLKVTNAANRDAYGVDGKTYALSVASWGGGILYNKALLDKVGFTDAPKTWDEFLALCKKLKDAGITPYYDGVQSGNMMPLYAQLGLSFSKEGGGIDQKIFSGQSSFEKEWTEPLKLYMRLYDEDLVSRDVVGLSDDQIVNEFGSGRVAMMGAGPWNINGIRGIDPNIQINFMQIPGPNAGELFLAGAASPGYAINAKTEHGDAAEKFLAFLSTKDAVEMFHKSSNAITTTADYTPDLDPVLNALYDGIKESHIYLPMTAWPRDQDALHTEMVAKLQEMVSGQIAPVDVAKALDAKLAEANS